MNNYQNIRKLLADEESIKIFDARIEYMNTNDINVFIKKMHTLYKYFEYPELELFLSERGLDCSLVIFGAGKEGEITFEILKHTKFAGNIYGFVDNNSELWGSTKCNFPVFSIYDLLSEKKEIIYILASSKHNFSFLQQLLNLYVPQKNIFIAPFNALTAQRGWQYFDMFQPSLHETFIDVGAYDGKTSKDFLRWCHGKFDDIYMFELDKNMESVCYSNLEISDNKIHFIGKGCWDNNTILKSISSQNSSHLIEDFDNSDGKETRVCSLDSELENISVTFIKMDIEGAEMKALQGTERIIKNLKPKLAISVYHKKEDMINIINYLHTLNSEYKFFLRHYSAHQWETILYAF